MVELMIFYVKIACVVEFITFHNLQKKNLFSALVMQNTLHLVYTCVLIYRSVCAVIVYD